MPKPTSQQELLTANSDAFETLNRLIDSLTIAEREREFSFPHRDRNIRDVVAHLLEWQQMLFGWYRIGMRGGAPEMPAKGLTWRSTPELNQHIWETYQSHSLKTVRGKLAKSHEQLQRLVEKHPDEELFAKRLYPWTGSTSLGVYLTAAGWSHYHWAIKLVRKFVKEISANRKE